MTDKEKLNKAIEALEYYLKWHRDSRNWSLISQKIRETLKEIEKERQKELIIEMMHDAEEMGLYDEESRLPDETDHSQSESSGKTGE